ncbi:MAG: hypothetical protein U5K30_01505 [Acidimicrobiales bacterium]|nr:hypothetical protein [Acidimicrobiales bacterium]
MSEQRDPAGVTDIREYTRETLRQLDEAMRDYKRRRRELTSRLAVLDAADDPELARMVAEVEELVETGVGMLAAEPAEEVLSEAYKRYVR